MAQANPITPSKASSGHGHHGWTTAKKIALCTWQAMKGINIKIWKCNSA